MTAPMWSKTKRSTLEKGGIESSSLGTNTINSLDNIASASNSTTSLETHILYDNSLDSNRSPIFNINSLFESSLASNSSLESTLKPTTLEPTTLEPTTLEHLLANNTTTIDSPLSKYTDSTYIDAAIPSLPPNKPLIPRKFEDMTDFYEDQDTLLIIADILTNEVRYHHKTADFNDGVCLIKNVTKGLDAIKKTRDLMLNMHSNKLKEGFKKQFAGAKTLKVQGLWIEAFTYEHIVTIVKNRSARSYAKTPNVTANYSAVEIEVANEIVRLVSLAENPDTFCKYYHY
jgi:hypothetical protein